MNQTALVMCLADPSGNPRPNRLIRFLSNNDYIVDVLSFSCKTPLDIRKHYPIRMFAVSPIQRRLSFHRWVIYRTIQRFLPSDFLKNYLNDLFHFLQHYRQIFKENHYDLIVVEDLQLLPLAFKIKKNAFVLFDAREYYPRQREDQRLFRLLEKPERLRLCRQFLHKCDKLITVSPGLAEEYFREFGVKTHVIMSAPYYYDVTPRKTNPSHIRMVHHGGASRNRKLENMIEIVTALDNRFTLDFYLTGSPDYIQELKRIASPCNRIRFCHPVPFDEIIQMLSAYDIGMFYVEPTTFNLLNCLPNKLFEFIQARLMVAIGPSPDMASIVKRFDCGVVADSFNLESMVSLLFKLDGSLIDSAKFKSDVAAKTLCYEVEAAKLMNFINEEVGQKL